MPRAPRRLLVALACWCAAAWAGALPEAAAQPPHGVGAARALVIGRVTTNPRKDFERHKAFGDYLAAHLGGFGVSGSSVRFAKDMAEMTALLRKGEVDVVAESVFAALALADGAGAELALREWRNGLPSNHAILFARKDSGIASLADLTGRRVAFEDPGSATSYILPRVALERAGHRLAELPATAAPRSDAVGYVFAQEEINVTTWVHKGRADAGALGNQDWDDPERVPPAMREDLRIFHRTEPVPRSLLLLRGDLPAPLKHRIKEVLLAAHDDAEGRRVLDLYRGVTRYDVLEGQAAAEVAAAWRIAQALR